MTRLINALLWSTTMRDLDANEKLVYFYLLTNQKTNAAGVYEISLRQISEEVCLQPHIVQSLLQRLEEAGLAAYVDGYILVKDWEELQGLRGMKHEVAVRKILDKLPAYVLAKYRWLYGISDEVADTQSDDRVSNRVSDRVSHTPSDRVSDTPSARERERENERESSKEKDKEKEKENIYNTPYGVEAAVPAPPPPSANADEKGLFKRLFSSFLAVTPTIANRDKEAACVKTLIRYAKGDEEFLRETLEYFIRLRKTDKYWRKKPLLPSVLVYYWDHVRALIDEDKAKHNFGCLDALNEQQSDSRLGQTSFSANIAHGSSLHGNRTAWISLKTA